MHSLRFGLAAALSVGGFGAIEIASSPLASADTPTGCHADTSQPRSYDHGSPIKGLLSRHGYYYLDVKFGPGCGLGSDGLVHIVAHVHALKILPSQTPGDFNGAYTPTDKQHAVYWLEFHGGSDGGKQYTLPGGEFSSKYVSTTNHEDACFPESKKITEICQDGPGTGLLTLRYNGPDVFNLSHGGDIRVRIANESGLVITDFAQIDVVKSSTANPPIVG